MDCLRQITLFQLFYVLNRFPALLRFVSFLFFLVQTIVIVKCVGVAVVLVLNRIERHLFFDVAFTVNHSQIQQMSFTSVYTYDMNIVSLLQPLTDFCVNIVRFATLEVESYRYMEQEFIHREPFVFDKVIRKLACFIFAVWILFCNRLIGRVCRFGIVKAFLPEKDLCMSVELINTIVQISLIKEHLPIKRMHVRRSFFMF